MKENDKLLLPWSQKYNCLTANNMIFKNYGKNDEYFIYQRELDKYKNKNDVFFWADSYHQQPMKF